MARTTEEVYQSMMSDKLRYNHLNVLTSSSATSIWRLIFYVIAYNISLLERLWDIYRSDVEKRIEEIVPHRPRWYAAKVLSFMADTPLIQDTDRYDTSGMSEEQISEATVVKYAAVTESTDSSVVVIKVAGEKNGERTPLSPEIETQLRTYIQEVKDAGVAFILVNQEGDRFSCSVDIYYNALLYKDDVEEACRTAIVQYIENLPFNGEYTNMALIDTLQKVEGVKIAELKTSSFVSVDNNREYIDARAVPAAGYYKADDITLNMIAYAL